MKLTDAIKVLGLTGDITKEIVKKAYAKLAFKYHPDRGGCDETMKMINEAYETLKDYEGRLETDQLDYTENLNAAVLKIIDLPGLIIEVCGAWTWVSGDTKPYKDILKAVGFKWIHNKTCWAYRPDDWKSRSRGSWSMREIRSTYGSSRPKRRDQLDQSTQLITA